MDVRGQGALEYLLLIGGAVLVAAIVIALITGVPATVSNPEAETYCASQPTYETCIIGCIDATDGSHWDCDSKETDGTSNSGTTASSDLHARCGVSFPARTTECP